MRRLAAALLSLGLLAAACSGTGEAAPTTTVTSPTTTAAPAPAPAPAPTTSTPPPATTETPTPTVTSTTAAPATAASEDEQKAEADGGAESSDEPTDPLGAAIGDWMERTGAPGLVLAMTQGGAEPMTFAWGVSDIATGAPLTADHHVRIGSVTKSVTAAVVLQLVAESAVELDAPVVQYLDG